MKLTHLLLGFVALFAFGFLWEQRSTAATAVENAALSAKLATLEARVQALDDIYQIERLQRIYGYYLDKKLWDEIIPLYTKDARVEIGGRGIYVGREHIAHLFKDVMGSGKEGLEYGALHNHLQLQGVVDVDPSGKTAMGRWRAFMQVGLLLKSAIWAEGPYEIEYERVNGKWMFSRMRWYPTYYVPYDKGWDKLEGASGGASTSTNPQYPPDLAPTPGYAPFPHVYVAPFHYKNPVTGR